jgi:hypothetical protein
VLREQVSLDSGTALAIVRALRRTGPTTVDGAQVRRVFPELRWMRPMGPVDLRDEEQATETFEQHLSVPEEMGPRFWARAGFRVHPLVVDLHSGTRYHHVELHLLTDGRRDWWFTYPATNYAGGWEIGPSTRTSRRARLAALRCFIGDAYGWVMTPDEVRTPRHSPGRTTGRWSPRRRTWTCGPGTDADRWRPSADGQGNVITWR